ncbi:ATP-dependent DNA helicase [Trichonephila clavipes]|nr:ATP-dependent DNA helicase [Trichonephila clavipes]
MGLITKRIIKAGLQYLVATPLYRRNDVTIDYIVFNLNQCTSQVPQDEISENINIEESFTAQQQTLLRNEEKYLRVAPGEANVPRSLLFHQHAEEFSFPAIYLGHFRNFRERVRVSYTMIATSELRRVDRHGVTPQHLLYMAMIIMQLRE